MCVFNNLLIIDLDEEIDLNEVITVLSKKISRKSKNNSFKSDNRLSPEKIIYNYLKESGGWVNAFDLKEKVNLSEGIYQKARMNLIDRGVVEKMGEKRGTKYRIAN